MPEHAHRNPLRAISSEGDAAGFSLVIELRDGREVRLEVGERLRLRALLADGREVTADLGAGGEVEVEGDRP